LRPVRGFIHETRIYKVLVKILKVFKDPDLNEIDIPKIEDSTKELEEKISIKEDWIQVMVGLACNLI